MKLTSKMSLVALLAAGVLPALGAAPAGAAGDTTAPALSLDAAPHYVTGSQVATAYDAETGRMEYWELDLALRWTTSDASGICGQAVTERSYDTLGGDQDAVLGSDTVAYEQAPEARRYAFRSNLFNDERGPGSFVVRSTDCAGNTSTSEVARTGVGFVEDSSSRVTYRGAWKTAKFSGFSGGSTHYATAAGARATTTVEGGAVALVMEKASNRGAADVLVDGVRKATVNTYAATTTHRAVVWEAVLSPGTHTITVVNKATPGHPRIDLDLVLAQ